MSVTSALVLLAAMSVSATVLLIVVALVWWIDRYDREPIHLVVMVFLWGASVAPLAAVMSFPFLESIYRQLSQSESTAWLSIGFFTPLIEELAKGIGVLLVVVFSSKFDNPTDGIVYGTAAGLGFAVTENVMYGVASVHQMPHLGGILFLVGGRTLLSAGVHALSSATLGGFLGHSVLSGTRRGKIGWALTGLLSAILLHGSWNVGLVWWGPVGEDGTPRLWLASLPFLYLVYVVVLGIFLHSEHRILKRQLDEEVALGLAPSWVVDVIPFYRRRVRANWWPSRSERTVIARLMTRMAFRKQALQNLPPGEAAIASLEVVKLRQRLREILDPEEPEAT